MCKAIFTILALGLSFSAFSQCGFESDIQMLPSTETGIYCSYDTVKLEVVEAFDNYQWYYNFDGSTSGLLSIEGATEPALKISAGYYGYAFFFVELTRDGCTQLSEPAVIDTWAFAPIAIEHSPQSQFCRGDSTLLRNAFGRYASYQWYRDGAIIPGATDSIYWARQSGTYVLNASPFECPETVISSGVGPTITFTGPEVPAITFEGGLLNASSGPNYQWLLNGEEIAGATQQSYEPQESGLYTVSVYDGSGCRPVSAPFLFNLTSTQQPLWASQFRIFPNPTAGQLSIETPTGLPLQLRLLATDGRKVWHGQYEGGRLITVDMAAYPNGTYWMLMKREGQSAAFRIVKN